MNPGLARSATTRRDGFVTLPDVGVTVLDSLGVDPPSSMNATAITSAGGPRFDAGQAARLADADEVARFRDRAVGPVSVVYIVLQVITYALAAVALSKQRRTLAWVVGLGTLAVLATPTVVFLSGLVRYDRLGQVPYVIAVVGRWRWPSVGSPPSPGDGTRSCRPSLWWRSRGACRWWTSCSAAGCS